MREPAPRPVTGGGPDAASWAVFHGTPAEVLSALGDDPSRLGNSGWLRGVALTAAGRYGEALAIRLPLVLPPGPDTDSYGRAAGGDTVPDVRVRAAATLSSLLRQVGAHEVGAAADGLGLALAARAAASPGLVEAAADCALGLVADDVGRGRVASARVGLAAAELRVAALPPSAWRCRVRLAWVRAETALLTDDPAAALAVLPAALARARRAAAPRHVVKTLLFLGVVQQAAGGAEAAATLRVAAARAEALGLVPLVWPARLVLGRLLAASGGGGGGGTTVAGGGTGTGTVAGRVADADADAVTRAEGRRLVQQAEALARGLAAPVPPEALEGCAARLDAAARRCRGG